MDNTESVLRRAPLFDGLDDEDARALRRQMAEVKLSRGEHLFMEGDDGDALYVVIEGKMKLTRAAADGGRADHADDPENGNPKTARKCQLTPASTHSAPNAID